MKLGSDGYRLSQRLGSQQRGDVLRSTMLQEVMGEPSVETLERVRSKPELRTTCGSTAVQLRMRRYLIIYQLSVIGSYIFYISGILQATFYLKGGDSRFKQSRQQSRGIEVFE